jgi:hypothetical protein
MAEYAAEARKRECDNVVQAWAAVIPDCPPGVRVVRVGRGFGGKSSLVSQVRVNNLENVLVYEGSASGQ